MVYRAKRIIGSSIVIVGEGWGGVRGVKIDKNS